MYLLMSSGGWIRTHSYGHVIKEQFTKHLPVGPPDDVTQRRPRRRLVRVKYRLESDAETDNEHDQHEQELDEFSQLRQQAYRR